MKKITVGTLMMTGLVGWALAAEWWEKKPYREWNGREVKRMLDRSPWGKIHTITILNPMHTGDRNFQTIGGGDLEREKHNHFHIRFLTAAPIRMALARDMVLKSKEEPDRGALDRFVEQGGSEEHILVTLNLTSEPAGADSLRFYWSTLMGLTTPELAKETFLATKSGKRAYLSRYEPPGEDGLGAKLYFPRMLPNGQPLLTPEEKEIRFETQLTLDRLDLLEPGGRRSRTDRIHANFKVDQMMFQGELEF